MITLIVKARFNNFTRACINFEKKLMLYVMKFVYKLNIEKCITCKFSISIFILYKISCLYLLC